MWSSPQRDVASERAGQGLLPSGKERIFFSVSLSDSRTLGVFLLLASCPGGLRHTSVGGQGTTARSYASSRTCDRTLVAEGTRGSVFQPTDRGSVGAMYAARILASMIPRRAVSTEAPGCGAGRRGGLGTCTEGPRARKCPVTYTGPRGSRLPAQCLSLGSHALWTPQLCVPPSRKSTHRTPGRASPSAACKPPMTLLGRSVIKRLLTQCHSPVGRDTEGHFPVAGSLLAWLGLNAS